MYFELLTVRVYLFVVYTYLVLVFHSCPYFFSFLLLLLFSSLFFPRFFRCFFVQKYKYIYNQSIINLPQVLTAVLIPSLTVYSQQLDLRVVVEYLSGEHETVACAWVRWTTMVLKVVFLNRYESHALLLDHACAPNYFENYSIDADSNLVVPSFSARSRCFVAPSPPFQLLVEFAHAWHDRHSAQHQQTCDN